MKDKTKLDWCFKDKTKEVGYWYYVNNKVNNVIKNKNIYTCYCDQYKTKVELDNDKEIDDMECTCSYYENEDNYCPHLYALICHINNVSKEESNYNVEALKKYKNLNTSKIKHEYEKKHLDLIDLDILGYNYEDISKEPEEEKETNNSNFKELITEMFNKECSTKTDNINIYEPYQFEEEELEDDDYYFEDDNEK